MPSGSSERVLRGGSDEKLIQSIVEKVLASETFINKIVCAMRESFQAEIKAIRQEYENKVRPLEKQLSELQVTCDNLEQYSRVNNVRIFGVEETDNENVCETVLQLCNNKLGVKLAPSDIDVCYRLPKGKSSVKSIMVRFTRRTVKDQIYGAKRKLKGTKIVIREDLTKRRQNLLKMAFNIVGPRNAFTRNENIYIKRGTAISKIDNDCDLLNLSINA